MFKRIAEFCFSESLLIAKAAKKDNTNDQFLIINNWWLIVSYLSLMSFEEIAFLVSRSRGLITGILQTAFTAD